jgi:two-component system response regulator NreC
MTGSADSTPPLRLVLADDHRLVRAGIRMLIESVPGWRVVAVAGDGDAALREVLDHRPDILVLDLGMPGRPSLGLLPELARRVPDARVVVVTMQSDPALARAALAAGAAGYVLKDAADTELEQAIRAVAHGGSYLDPSLGALVAAARADQADRGLSDREVEVLRLIALGHTNAEIATTLGLSVRTVESHRSHILEKTGCRTRAQLVQFALSENLIVRRPEFTTDRSHA